MYCLKLLHRFEDVRRPFESTVYVRDTRGMKVRVTVLNITDLA